MTYAISARSILSEPEMMKRLSSAVMDESSRFVLGSFMVQRRGPQNAGSIGHT